MAPASVQRVLDAAATAGVELDIVEYPDGTRTAVDAAAAVGCEVGQIVKSLVFDLDGELILALTSGSNRVDADLLAAVAGGSVCGRADVDRVRDTTGFAIGGVPPFGHASAIRAFVDPALETYDRIWAAAGTPRHVFPIQPETLRSLSNATSANFTEGV